MKHHSDAVRTSLDLPRDLHRRVHEAAARQDSSAPGLTLEDIEKAVAEPSAPAPKRRLNLEDNPPIPAAGRRLGLLSNEEIHDLIDFP